MTNAQAESIHQALDSFRIELPSWGFANTGTRFGKFLQPAAATSIEEKFSDAAQVDRWTGVCPTIAIHVLWPRRRTADLRSTPRRAALFPAMRGKSKQGPLLSSATFADESSASKDALWLNVALQRSRFPVILYCFRSSARPI